MLCETNSDRGLARLWVRSHSEIGLFSFSHTDSKTRAALHIFNKSVSF